MADISKIKINNVSYDIKDALVRTTVENMQDIVRTDKVHIPHQIDKGTTVEITYDSNVGGLVFTQTNTLTGVSHEVTLPILSDGELATIGGELNNVVYDSETGRIRFYNRTGGVLAALDATPFIKDAMVSNVAITGGNLVITWNSDAGIQPTSIPLTDIFNPANYYNKDEIDQIVADVEAGQVGIVDNLTTDDATKALSAKQGKVLQDNKANKNEMTVTDVTGDATKKNIQLKFGTSQNVVVEHQDISGKQDKINDLAAIRSGAGKGNTSVQTISVNGGTPTQPTDGNVDITIPSAAWADVKPSGGVPKSDLASDVQTSLGKADSAIQGVKVNGTELTPDSSKKVDVTVPTKLSDLSADATHRLVTDTEKSTWNGKQNALTFDNVPTKTSANPVKSGGVYSALADLYDGYDSATETLSFTFPTE